MTLITQSSVLDTNKDIWNVALVHLLLVHTGFSPLIPENYIKTGKKGIKPIKIFVWVEKLVCRFPQDNELDKICAGIFTKLSGFHLSLPPDFISDGQLSFKCMGLLFLWFGKKRCVWNIWSKQERTVCNGKTQTCYSVTITSDTSGYPEARRPFPLFDGKATLPWK